MGVSSPSSPVDTNTNGDTNTDANTDANANTNANTDANTNAIASVGVYTPRYRIDAETVADALGGFDAPGVSTKSVPAGDEDTVTMGVEAAERALDSAGTDAADVESLLFATTTPPYEEFDVGVTVAEILGLDDDVRIDVATQSTNAGVRALRTGFEKTGPTLVVAADAPRAGPTDAVDHAAGAGAVAFLLSPGGTVELVDASTQTEEYPGTRFRRRGRDGVEAYDATAYERRAFVSPIASAVGKLDDPATDVAVTAPDGSLPHRAVRALDVEATAFHVAGEFGDLGAASAAFGTVAAWNEGVDRVTVVGYGDGATVDALVLDGALPTTFERETEFVGYGAYLRKRGHVGGTGGGD